MAHINIAGIYYDLNRKKGKSFLYRGFNEFQKDFENSNNSNTNHTIHILKKYMNSALYKSEQKKMIEANESERKDLIKILEKRAGILHNSIVGHNTIVTTIPLKKRHKALLKFIKEIKEYVNPDTIIHTSDDTIEGVNKIIALDRDCLIEFVLELSWLLLNPDHVYADIKTYWKEKIENLDNIKLNEIVSIVKSEGITPARVDNTFIDIIQDEDFNNFEKNRNIMKRRIEILLNIMVLQRYYDMNTKKPILLTGGNKDNNQLEDEKEEQTNQSISVFNKPLINVMNPIFEYFNVFYDPIYSFINNSIVSHIQHIDSNTIEKIIIPSLLMIHHICNNIIQEGVYRIIHINNDVITFINNIIKNTNFDETHFQLPKLYLSTLLNKSKVHTYPDILDYVQLFTVGNNLNINSTKYKETSFFNNKYLYIIKSNKEIPFNLYEIDFNSINMYSPLIKNKKLNNKYVNTETPKKISDIVSLSNNFNNAQLTLSIFIAFKELMSK